MPPRSTHGLSLTLSLLLFLSQPTPKNCQCSRPLCFLFSLSRAPPLSFLLFLLQHKGIFGLGCHSRGRWWEEGRNSRNRKERKRGRTLPLLLFQRCTSSSDVAPTPRASFSSSSLLLLLGERPSCSRELISRVPKARERERKRVESRLQSLVGAGGCYKLFLSTLLLSSFFYLAGGNSGLCCKSLESGSGRGGGEKGRESTISIW